VVASSDPYKTLGISHNATDAELRSAYRRLVRLHHPDHNGGSVESARRFEEVQEAYARIRELRKHAPPPPPHQPGDPDLDARMQDIERDVREAAAQARERARRAAREAAAAAGVKEGARERPSDEELGYVTTDDSFSKIVSDVWDELSDRFSEARDHPAVKRVEDLIDDLEQRYRPKR
jgi:curved DNA-binding protein CbpA